MGVRLSPRSSNQGRSSRPTGSCSWIRSGSSQRILAANGHLTPNEREVSSGGSFQAMLAAHATEKPEPIDKRRPSVPPALSSLIMRSLEKHAADRPQSAGEMLADLEAAVTPSGATPPTGFTSAMRSKRWPKRLIIGGAAVALALLAGARLPGSARDKTLSRTRQPHARSPCFLSPT